MESSNNNYQANIRAEDLSAITRLHHRGEGFVCMRVKRAEIEVVESKIHPTTTSAQDSGDLMTIEDALKKLGSAFYALRTSSSLRKFSDYYYQRWMSVTPWRIALVN